LHPSLLAQALIPAVVNSVYAYVCACPRATCIGNDQRAIDPLSHAQVGGKVSEAMGSVKETVGKAFGANQCAPLLEAGRAVSLLACQEGQLG